MENNIKISVIIPAFNVEKYIERCINSVIQQSLKEIEIIVIDDGSTDKTLELIKEIEKNDKRVIVIEQENQGSSAARNSGLKRARGKYISFLDSDDWIEENYLYDIYTYAEKNSLDIVVTDFYKDDGRDAGYREDLNIENNKFISGKTYLEHIFNGNGYPNVWDKIVKRELYEKNSISFFPGIFLGDDILVTIQLAYFAKKVGKYNNAYVHYMQHGGQGSAREKLGIKILDLFKVFDQLDNFFKKNGESISGYEYYKLNEIYIKFLSCIPTDDKKYSDARDYFLKNIREIVKLKDFNRLSKKHRIRLKILAFLRNKKITDNFLKLKNGKRKKI